MDGGALAAGRRPLERKLRLAPEVAERRFKQDQHLSRICASEVLETIGQTPELSDRSGAAGVHSRERGLVGRDGIHVRSCSRRVPRGASLGCTGYGHGRASRGERAAPEPAAQQLLPEGRRARAPPPSPAGLGDLKSDPGDDSGPEAAITPENFGPVAMRSRSLSGGVGGSSRTEHGQSPATDCTSTNADYAPRLRNRGLSPPLGGGACTHSTPEIGVGSQAARKHSRDARHAQAAGPDVWVLAGNYLALVLCPAAVARGAKP
jgi:hypothetical protein